MRIVYFITTNDFGVGGHFYSLAETAFQLSKHESVFIVSIGSKPSPILKSQFKDNYHNITKKGIFAIVKELLRMDVIKNGDLFHAFDIHAFYFAKLVSLKKKTPLLLTRCGGPNPRYFPFNEHIVLYSYENREYLASQNKFKNSNFYVIPNRVRPPLQDTKAIAELRHALKKQHPVILRIARVSPLHEQSIQQSITLVKKLNAAGLSYQLVIIGVIQNQEIFERLKLLEDDNVSFITEGKYTTQASRLLDVADIVIGTGRSFMEAAIIGKKVLVPTRNLSIPEFVSEGNIDIISKLNFSPRYSSKLNDNQAFEDILMGHSDVHNFVQEYAKRHFDSERIYSLHAPVYKDVLSSKYGFYIFDFLIHTAYILEIKSRIKHLARKILFISGMASK